MSVHHQQILACAILCGLAWLGYFWVRLIQTAEKTEYFLKEEWEKRQ